MEKRINIIKNKEGWVTVVIILFIASVLPIYLFFFAEYNYLHGAKDKAQYMTDNIATSAIRSVDWSEIENGRIVIDQNEASLLGDSLIRSEYSSNEINELDIHVINEKGSFYTTKDGHEIPLNEPTVIVYTSIKPHNIFFKHFVTLKTISAYEISNATEVEEMLKEIKEEAIEKEDFSEWDAILEEVPRMLKYERISAKGDT